jgi:hypothetical protein
MATDTFVNILDLQPITEVVNGDYLIVETPAGTRIINFKDFILPNANILLSQTVSDNTTAILSNFSVTSDYIASLSASIDANLTTVSSVSSTLLNQIGSVYIGKSTITISSGASMGIGTLSPSTYKTISMSDIMITPANSYAAMNQAYVISLTDEHIVSITAPFSGSGVATENATYYLVAVVR